MTTHRSLITINMESVPGGKGTVMYSNVISGTISGIEGALIRVEADSSDGLPGLHMVGCLSNEIRESGERIRTALRNSGYHIPPKRIVVNLSPADIRKDGSGFDLPIAAAILAALSYIPQERLTEAAVLGELSLDGRLLPVNGVLPIADCLAEAGYHTLILPKANQREAALIPGLQVIGLECLSELAKCLNDDAFLENAVYRGGTEVCREPAVSEATYDFSNFRGQPMMRRAMEIAASGMHNLLMTGPPGAGKTLAAKCLTGILPDLSFEESMELTKIYSVRGMLHEQQGMLWKRPFRSPHHTITVSALIGGGVIPKPGEISLAHNGVLFLDELPEFSRNVIDALRQPLEDESVIIGRLNRSCRFPADVMLVGAMNPCPCGCYPDRSRCQCSIQQIERYQGRISRAILERIDLHLGIQPVSYAEMASSKREESSATIRKRVSRVHQLQQERYRDQRKTGCAAGKGLRFNARLTPEEIKRYCALGREEERFIQEVYEKKHLSARSYHRILRLARTIADMEESEMIRLPHLTEAAAYGKIEYGTDAENPYDRRETAVLSRPAASGAKMGGALDG